MLLEKIISLQKDCKKNREKLSREILSSESIKELESLENSKEVYEPLKALAKLQRESIINKK